MASYTETKRKAVKELIDTYTGDTLDNYTRDTIKQTAAKAMDENKTPIEVADAVYDIIIDKFSGDVVMAAGCQQICSKYILPVLRNEIISKLK